MIREEKVAVVGIGYVGLPVACIFAEKGFKTVGIDILKARVGSINKGICPIGGEEPGLAELLEDMVGKGMLSASTDPSSLKDADLVVVCVDTPVGEDKKPILNNLEKAITSIGEHMKDGCLVSVESTVPPGTMERLVIPVLEKTSGRKAGIGFSVVHCPERVMPGRLLANLREYKRVLGGLDDDSIDKAMRFYSTFVEDEIIPTSLVNAEICKTGENAYRDVQIAFANEMALICEELGADVFKVRDLINSCPFRDMHIPGSGVGGYCLPKDSWLLVANVEGSIPKVITGARGVNERMPLHLSEIASRMIGEHTGRTKSRKVAVMGLAFMRDSDDTRNSPALKVIGALKEDHDVVVHDPYVNRIDGVDVETDIGNALENAVCAIFVTDHTQYNALNPEFIKDKMAVPVVIDGRNIFDADRMLELGIFYRAIGKG